jgi:hypothetical protein
MRAMGSSDPRMNRLVPSKGKAFAESQGGVVTAVRGLTSNESSTDPWASEEGGSLSKTRSAGSQLQAARATHFKPKSVRRSDCSHQDIIAMSAP